MRICIYGVGAVGGLLAARLAAAGHEVNALARGETLAALQRDGIGLEEDGAIRRYPLRAVAEAAELGEQDLVILAVKQPALARAAASMGPLLGAHTRVMTAINGLPWWFFDGLPGPLAGTRLSSVDPDGSLHRQLPAARVIGCVLHLACCTAAPGVVRPTQGRRLILGEATGGAPAPATREAARLLAQAGFQVALSEAIQQDVWFKLWGNMTMNPVSALTGATTDRILDDPLLEAFCVAVMEEAAALGARIGCPVGQRPAERNGLTRQLGAMRTSMLQDVQAGRPLEVAALLGAVHEIAGLAGVALPHTGALLGLLRVFARERGLA